MGVIFVEPAAQVEEFERLLKTGGTLAFSSWAPDPANPFVGPIVHVIGPPAATILTRTVGRTGDDHRPASQANSPTWTSKAVPTHGDSHRWTPP